MWDWSENQIELVLLRHGATPANEQRCYLGKTEESLSKNGICELQRGKERGSYPKTDILFCSPMKRCLETAEILYPMKQPVLIPEWSEMDFGEFEGKNYIELQKNRNYQAWIDSNGTLPFPGGESREEFVERCKRGFYRMTDYVQEFFGAYGMKNQNQMVTIGTVVHGGTIMAVLSTFYGGSYYDYQVANGQGYRCLISGTTETPKLESLERIMGE